MRRRCQVIHLAHCTDEIPARPSHEGGVARARSIHCGFAVESSVDVTGGCAETRGTRHGR
jgi:hypothetical protein